MRYKAYRYRLYPNKKQQQLINQHIGCCRYVYNYGLEIKTKAYQTSKTSLSRFDIQKQLPSLKKQEETAFLNNVNSLSLQAALACLDNAFTRFFKEKKGYPRFKSKKSPRQSFIVPQNTLVFFDERKITLPKFKEGIKCRLHRRFNGDIKSSTISKTATGKYYISILVKLPEDNPQKVPIDENKAIGIDLGIKTFATLSNGETIENPRNLKTSIKKLKKLQRKLSRKKKGSKNYEKSRRVLSIHHEKIANKRNDFLEKTTHWLVTRYETICLETLSLKNMAKNHVLAQDLHDVSFRKFNDLIEQKAEWYGKNIIRIGRFEPSSKTCVCGQIYKELKLSQRTWVCPYCGRVNDRDLLAANNIKKFAFCKNNTAGTSEIHACGDMTYNNESAQEIHKS